MINWVSCIWYISLFVWGGEGMWIEFVKTNQQIKSVSVQSSSRCEKPSRALRVPWLLPCHSPFVTWCRDLFCQKIVPQFTGFQVQRTCKWTWTILFWKVKFKLWPASCWFLLCQCQPLSSVSIDFTQYNWLYHAIPVSMMCFVWQWNPSKFAILARVNRESLWRTVTEIGPKFPEKWRYFILVILCLYFHWCTFPWDGQNLYLKRYRMLVVDNALVYNL